jgi:hypothetical protein
MGGKSMLMPKTLHPTSRTLIAFLDSELSAAEQQGIAAHLQECDGCRTELDALETDLDWFLILEAAVVPVHNLSPDEGLKQVLAAGRVWQVNQREALAAEKQRSPVLEVIFGTGLAGAMREQAEEDGRAGAESLLFAFLGRRAAAPLISDLEGNVTMERFLAQT